MAFLNQDKLNQLALLWLRVLMGLGMSYHGFAKCFGGGIDKFAAGVGDMGFPFPLLFAWAAALSEFVGGICIAIGARTRVAAGFVFITMTVAAFMAHGSDPFKAKELALCYWVMSGMLIMTGGGRWSLDGK